jgi:signal transduction histidine kinase
MPTSPPSGADTREQEVTGLLGMVTILGNAAQMLFGRVYQNLGNKQKHATTSPPPESDPTAVLRAANRDLKARVKASETLAARLKAVFASLNEGVILQDMEGRLVLINGAAEELVGSVKNFWDSDLGRMFRNAAKPTATEAEMELIGNPQRIQINDRIVGAQLATVASPDGDRIGTVLVLRDVTREALADRLKDDFVTQVTHELRTPLTVIKSMSEVLLSQPDDRPPNRKFLDAIGRNAAVLDRMILELLDISEISAGSFAVRKKRVALDELVFDVIKGQDVRIKKAAISVGTMIANRERLNVLGDDQRLRWAIGHLLDNSLNYTLKGGSVFVRIGIIQGERVLIEVIDTGVGIAGKDLPHVFERFYRGEAKSPDGKTIDPRGLGQGLFVAKSVAEAHGGYVAVTSTVGKGSTFTLGLPFASATE